MSMFSPLILLIDDDQDDAFFVQDAFSVAGISCRFLHVLTAEAGIAYLAGTGEYSDRHAFPLPALVLLDLMLPGKSGHEILAWMRDQPELRYVIRVVLTGSVKSSDLRKSYELGANCYLHKPLTTEQLVTPGNSLLRLLSSPFVTEPAAESLV